MEDENGRPSTPVTANEEEDEFHSPERGQGLEQTLVDGSPVTVSGDVICPKCREVVGDDDGIVCDDCRLWLHHVCLNSKLKSKTARLFIQEEFVFLKCMSCQRILLRPRPASLRRGGLARIPSQFPTSNPGGSADPQRSVPPRSMEFLVAPLMSLLPRGDWLWIKSAPVLPHPQAQISLLLPSGTNRPNLLYAMVKKTPYRTSTTPLSAIIIRTIFRSSRATSTFALKMLIRPLLRPL